MSKQITVKQIASSIRRPAKQKLMLRALGLGVMNKEKVLPDNGAVRGVLNKIPHLVSIVKE